MMTQRNFSWMSVVTGIFATLCFITPVDGFSHMGGHGELPEIKVDPSERISGKVLILPCYMKHDQASENYKKCSQSPLVQKHLSSALLTDDGSLYVLIMDHKDAYETVKNLTSKNALAWGRTVKKQGVQGIVLQGIKEIKKQKK